MKNKKSILIIALSGVLYLVSAITFTVVSMGNNIRILSEEEKLFNEEFDLRSTNGFFDTLHNYNVYKSSTFTEAEINSFPKATQKLIKNNIDYFSWTSQLSKEYTDYLNNEVRPFFPPGESRNNEIERIEHITLTNSNAIIFIISSIIWLLATIGIVVGIVMLVKNKNKK